MALSQIAKMFAVIVVLALFGVGCNKGGQRTADQTRDAQSRADAGVRQPTADAGAPQDTIPEGWQVYRNPAWGVEQLAYPKGWYFRERTVEETEDPNILIMDFNDEDFFPTETEAFYPATLSIRQGGTIAEEEKLLTSVEVVSREPVVRDGHAALKWVTRTEFGGEAIETTSYLLEVGAVLYDLAGEGDPAILEQMFSTLSILGGE